MIGRKGGRPRQVLPSKGALRVRALRRRQKFSNDGPRELSGDEFHDVIEDHMHRWRPTEMKRLHKEMKRQLIELVRWPTARRNPRPYRRNGTTAKANIAKGICNAFECDKRESQRYKGGCAALKAVHFVMSRNAWKFTKRDVIRGVKAAEAAGLKVAGIDFKPDGEFRFVAVPDKGGEQQSNPSSDWDEALATMARRLKYVEMVPKGAAGFIFISAAAVSGRRCPGAYNSPEFLEAYWALRNGRAPQAEVGADRTKPGTINAAIVAFYQQPQLHQEQANQRSRPIAISWRRSASGMATSASPSLSSITSKRCSARRRASRRRSAICCACCA